jgi:hypothetical protein
METVNEALGLLRRQVEIETAMKEPGGIRITEEHELLVLRRRLASYPQAMQAVMQAAHALRRPVSEVTAEDVESWARSNPVWVMAAENIYQMFTRFGGAGFYVKRNSWSHPRAAARVMSVGGLTSGALPGPAPYHQPPGAKKLLVMAMISYRGEPAKIQELTSPGTFAYTSIDRPTSWQEQQIA